MKGIDIFEGHEKDLPLGDSMRMVADSKDVNDILADLKLEEKKSGPQPNQLMESHQIPGMKVKKMPSKDIGQKGEPTKDEKTKLSTSLLVYAVTDDKDELELLDDLGGVRESDMKRSKAKDPKERNKIQVDPMNRSVVVTGAGANNLDDFNPLVTEDDYNPLVTEDD